MVQLCMLSRPTIFHACNRLQRWLAFQLLHALAQCHEAGVCHGDIKVGGLWAAVHRPCAMHAHV